MRLLLADLRNRNVPASHLAQPDPNVWADMQGTSTHKCSCLPSIINGMPPGLSTHSSDPIFGASAPKPLRKRPQNRLVLSAGAEKEVEAKVLIHVRHLLGRQTPLGLTCRGRPNYENTGGFLVPERPLYTVYGLFEKLNFLF
jgi:hypothetical protein